MTASAVATPTKPPSPYAIFRNRSFTLLWTGQLISTMGSALTSLAASIYVYRVTGSAASVGLMLMATAAPTLLIGLVAGVYVDRLDRKRIMIATDIIRAVLVLSIPFLVPLNIAWLYILVALSASVGQFYDPAHESVLPEVASEQELAAANSMMAISTFGSTAIGFAASGLIASAADIKWAFYLDALSFLLSGLCILLIRFKPFRVEGKTNVTVVLRNLKIGVRFLFDTPILRSLFYVLIPVIISFGLITGLLLPFAFRALGANEFQYGIQEGMTSLGFVAGSLLMAGAFDRMREGPWLAISWLGMGLAGIAYSFVGSIPLAIVIVTISGFMNAPSSIARRVIIQRNTPRDMRGRVNSAFFVTRDVMFLIGMAAIGLADVIIPQDPELSVRIMYIIASLMVLGAGIWVLFLPGLRLEAAEWRNAIALLHGAPKAPGLGQGRPVIPADMDLLVGLLPSLSALTGEERESLMAHAQVVDTPAGTAVLRAGEAGDDAYFILAGRAVAGIATPEGGHRSLSSMQAGDFFGEIAALTGEARTADVVTEEPSTFLMVPGQTLRGLMANPVLSQLFQSTMSERLARTSLTELPRFAGYDQDALRQLRAAPAEQVQ